MMLHLLAFSHHEILTPSATGKFLSLQIRYCFAMDRRFKIAVICLLAVTFSGCISSNPSAEVMVDTNAKTKRALPGEPQNVAPLPQAPIGAEAPIGPH